MRNLQEQVKKAFCYQKLFWPFTVLINCSSDLKIFANSRPSASNFKSFSQSLEQFFPTVGQNNFGNKIPGYLLQLCFHEIIVQIFFYNNLKINTYDKLRKRRCAFTKDFSPPCSPTHKDFFFRLDILKYTSFCFGFNMYIPRNWNIVWKS